MRVTARLGRVLRFAVPVALLGVLSAGGCGPGNEPAPPPATQVPKGRIVRAGEPVRTAARQLPPGDSGLRVEFVRLGPDEAGRRIVTNVLSDQPGAFELTGQDARPISPGRYRVAVRVGPEGGSDELQGKYGPENSPIEVEVKPGEDLVIDLANYP